MKKPSIALAVLLAAFLFMACADTNASPVSAASSASAPSAPGSAIFSSSRLTPPEMAKTEAQSGPPAAASDESIPPLAEGFAPPAVPYTLNFETLSQAFDKEMAKNPNLIGATLKNSGPLLRLEVVMGDGYEKILEDDKATRELVATILQSLNALAREQDESIAEAWEVGYHGGLYDAYVVELNLVAEDGAALYTMVQRQLSTSSRSAAASQSGAAASSAPQ